MSEAQTANLTVANMDESIALPRKNGELVFEEPWEARAFGLAVALNEEGVYPWQTFSGELAETIASAEAEVEAEAASSPAAEAQADEPSDYYQRWLASLEALLLEQGLVTPAELEAEIAEQIHHEAHDHDHEHHHH